MMGRSVALTETREERTLFLPLTLRPMTFEEFVRLFGEDDDIELVDGMVGAKIWLRRTSMRTCFGGCLSC